MPQRGQQQAAGNGLPRHRILYMSATQAVTLTVFKAASAENQSVREVENTASLVTDMVPNKSGEHGLQALNLLLRSSTLADFRQSLEALPVSLRPIQALSNVDLIRLALSISAGRSNSRAR